MKNPAWKKLVLIGITVLGLQGCIAITGAAVGATATAAVYDRRTLQAIMKDQDISTEITNQINADTDMKEESHIVVACYRGTVLLAGQAPDPAIREKVDGIARSVSGVKRIYNQITLEAPTSNLTRTSDTWITTKLKTAFLATKNLKSGQFKVVTENGIVYLMGVVSRSQADAAVQIARKVSGVQKVVKVFEYTREPDVTATDTNATASTATSDTDATAGTNATDNEADVAGDAQ
ncbi:MAG: BON domain-containing protein [Pseudomonadota bacterium]|nr:BON domain-containing protein [Gammaproteobacteria bacterium]MBU1558862.1 BON domain-containing protein [Gammaproteobacteria bacterium]MBU1927258.1 BON domain-containing protein [Gammaproteobacteria bacterium]MBU2545952.1 BON domain-containing protein [Gammaproteobacteria bacterium]